MLSEDGVASVVFGSFMLILGIATFWLQWKLRTAARVGDEELGLRRSHSAARTNYSVSESRLEHGPETSDERTPRYTDNQEGLSFRSWEDLLRQPYHNMPRPGIIHQAQILSPDDQYTGRRYWKPRAAHDRARHETYGFPDARKLARETANVSDWSENSS